MSTRAALLTALAALAAGAVLLIASPWGSDQPTPTPTVDPHAVGAGTAETLHATGGREQGSESLSASADPSRPDEAPGASRNGLQPTTAAHYAEVLLEAQVWIQKRRAAKAADDEAAEEAARAEWERARKRLLDSMRRDLPKARDFLAWLGAYEDEEAALYVGRIFPFVWAKGFETHLLRTAESGAPVLERRLALIGLRGRGLAAAGVVTRVATKAKNTALRAHATEEIASHLGDPHAAPKRGEMHTVATRNLTDPEPSVRRAALVALISDRHPLTTEEQAAVRARLEDSNRGVRDLASALLGRQK